MYFSVLGCFGLLFHLIKVLAEQVTAKCDNNASWQPLKYSAGVVVYFRAAGCSDPSAWRRRFSRVAVYFCELLQSAAPQSSHSAFMFPHMPCPPQSARLL